MALSLGATTLSALYLGSTAISTAYLGSVQVYDAGGAFTPADLFASGEEGAWYEPSPTTCFTDTAGTTAASVGDAVARINDLSGNGNHATQATAAARPLLQQTAGGLYYLAFDGSDDHLVTPATVDLSSTDKLTIISAAEKESDALSVIIDNGNAVIGVGTFYHGVGTISSSGQSWWAASRGTATGKVDQAATSTATFPAPITNVLTAQHDIAGDLTSLRVDGAANGTDGVGEKGLGNFANYNFWVGARAFNGGSLFFDGKLFSLIVRGAASTAGEISDTESYVANLSGVTI